MEQLAIPMNLLNHPLCQLKNLLLLQRKQIIKSLRLQEDACRFVDMIMQAFDDKLMNGSCKRLPSLMHIDFEKGAVSSILFVCWPLYLGCAYRKTSDVLGFQKTLKAVQFLA
ncbi:hypothetical protein AAHE18_U000400 [Arachis hypogaea]